MLTLSDLHSLVAAGQVDTVIVAFADMQGRLTGKRVSARLFVEDVAAHGAECCNYLLAVDVDMNTVDGYAISSWETGYGDMVMTPDFATLRLLPWLPGTALVMADLSFHGGVPVRPAPRTILRAQLDRLDRAGLRAFVGTELEFMVFDDTYKHQVWNDTDGTRVVLFLDVRLPDGSAAMPGVISRVAHRALKSLACRPIAWGLDPGSEGIPMPFETDDLADPAELARMLAVQAELLALNAAIEAARGGWPLWRCRPTGH